MSAPNEASAARRASGSRFSASPRRVIGRDTWPYTTVAVIAGAVLFFFGVIANRKFLRDRIVNRGALRRGGLADRERAERARKRP